MKRLFLTRIALVGLLAAVASVSALAQVKGLSAPPPAPPAALEGYVREAGTHAPIPNAFVTVIGAATNVRKVTVSDSQGRFVVPDLPPGWYGVAADVDGFAFEPATAPGAILEAGRATAVNIDMLRAAVIVGAVHDDQGTPRGGISVTVIRNAKGGGTELSRVQAAPTDDRGEFKVDRLPPGEYVVLASPPEQREAGTAVMPTYYPDVTDAKSATTVTVAAGQTVTGTLITMQTAPAFEITGTVVDDHGQPVRAMLAFVSESVQTWVPNQSAGMRVKVRAVLSRPDGTFRIPDLGPGSYRLTPLSAATAPAQLSPEIMAAAIGGNNFTRQVDVRGADVNGVTIVFH